MNIFVGNLSFEAKEADVYKLFTGFGSVAFVSIVMEKKGKKSRGFGFLQMPDEQQAQAAIAALNGKEFMGRPLNVELARPKPEVGRGRHERKKFHPEIKPEGQQHPGEGQDRRDVRFNPAFRKRGRYKTGRRSLSYLKKRAEAGIEEPAIPPRKHHENPMRWRKKPGQPKPWQKKNEESKPWEKSHGEFRPKKKAEGESKPWQKKPGESKPWEKAEGGPKSWQKSGDRKKRFQFKGRKKSSAGFIPI